MRDVLLDARLFFIWGGRNQYNSGILNFLENPLCV